MLADILANSWIILMITAGTQSLFDTKLSLPEQTKQETNYYRQSTQTIMITITS
jgi:hypothetical protein